MMQAQLGFARPELQHKCIVGTRLCSRYPRTAHEVRRGRQRTGEGSPREAEAGAPR